MNELSIMVLLIALSIFSWIVAISRLGSVVSNHRAKAWISVIFFSICFWSAAAAIVVKVSL